METLLQDLRYAARSLRKNPGFTAVAVLTLALGIGANATMFGVLDALFLSPPPGVYEAEQVQRIYIVRNEGTMSTPEGGGGSYPDYQDLRAGTNAFASIGGQLSPREMSLGRGEAARQVMGQLVTGGYFPTLGTQPALGRFFGPAEDSISGGSPVAVISHGFWQSNFGGAADVIGRKIFLEGSTYIVSGVAPEHFHGIDNEPIDIWVPTAMNSWETFLTHRGTTGLKLFGRLAEGVPPELAAEQAAAALRHASESAAFPEWLEPDPTPGVFLGPTNEALGPKRAEAATVALWLALVTGIVLLIACANVANLLLARASRRRREIAVRLALGVSRVRLVRQLLTESVLLALIGGAAGLLLAIWASDLIHLFPLPPIPSVIDGRMFAFVLGVSVLTGLVFGTIPALQASRPDLVADLKEGARSEGPSRSRTRTALLVTQVALSLVLLIGAGLLVRSLAAAQSVELGLDLERLLYVSVDLDQAGLGDAAQEVFRTRAVERLAGLPGVAEVTTAFVTPCQVMTAWGTVDGAVDAMRCGARDYIEKPWDNQRLLTTLRTQVELGRALRRSDVLEDENRRLRDADVPTMIAESRVMQPVLHLMERVAPSDANILITGEHGTGKEVVARWLHMRSKRVRRPLVPVNAGGISEGVFESELFGHVKGAFTDAKSDRSGYFEAADGGTLFLDEIGNLPANLQAKLLRVLQTGEFQKVGSSRTQRADVRLLSATNVNIGEEVANGRFREDLLYRLNTVEIALPPLRERREDIPPLASYFLSRQAQRYGKEIKGFNADAMRTMLEYPWPGNIRELEHTIERAVLLAGGERVGDEDLNLRARTSSADPLPLDEMPLEDVERLLIKKSLDRHQGNVSQAAEALGLSHSALYRRLQRYGL